MSNYKVEIWQEHWYSEGMVFDTREEAKQYAEKRRTHNTRVVETDDPANYRFEDGKLAPGKRRTEVTVATWEEFIKAHSGDTC